MRDLLQNECSGNCLMHQHAGGIYHRHCELCNALVPVEQAGPSYNEIDVDASNGMVCHGEVVCADCTTTLTPDGSRMCSACAIDAARKVQETVGFATVEVERGLSFFSEAFARETNPIALAEIIPDLKRWAKQIADLLGEVDGKIQSAYGAR